MAEAFRCFLPIFTTAQKTTFGLGYGSFNSCRAFGEFNSGVVGKKALYVRASQIYSDGYKYSSSNNSRSAFVSGGLFYDKTIWKINLLAGHQQNQLAWLGVADSLIAKDRRTNANKNERDNFTQCLAQLENKWRIRSSSVIQSSIYYTYLKGNYDFNLNGFLGLPTTNEMYNYAFRSNLLGFFSNYTLTKKDFTLTTGLHGNLYSRQHIGSERTSGILYTNTGYKNEVSAFSKAEYVIHKFMLFADVQYRYVTFDYKGDASFKKLTWKFLNPKAGVSYEINNHSTIYYSVGKTGREPTRNDMFGGNDNLLKDTDGRSIISITTPEFVVDHELGIRQQGEHLSLNANAYYMDFKNEIVLDGKFGPNGLALTDKVEKSYRTGLEIQIIKKAGKYFSLINNSSFNYCKIKEQYEVFKPILTPPVIINQEITFTVKGFLAGVSARWQDASYIDFANTSSVKSYVLMNARVQFDWQSFQISLFANNITNTHYFNNGYIDYDGTKKYFVQAPFNCYASVKYSL